MDGSETDAQSYGRIPERSAKGGRRWTVGAVMLMAVPCNGEEGKGSGRESAHAQGDLVGVGDSRELPTSCPHLGPILASVPTSLLLHHCATKKTKPLRRRVSDRPALTGMLGSTPSWSSLATSVGAPLFTAARTAAIMGPPEILYAAP